ncbi:hypothetical protein C1646_729579 [Rhizophagus diaphanus]|nr:hypothetical protein C1646_729579 [Rhizophagus diaphanus] [Rhizophagus sp. MUCL 43196]
MLLSSMIFTTWSYENRTICKIDWWFAITINEYVNLSKNYYLILCDLMIQNLI